ncbi:MAG: hypothetical protein MJY45_00465 [Bacteroidales bacterium]|nr:hypothetical protein [Bacteroidales bacterium]
MKLLGSLYNITEESDNSYTVCLDPENFIYKAHFPGEPVTPGVVIIQIAVELLERKLGVPIRLEGISNVKFLRIINPLETPSITFSYNKILTEEGQVKALTELTGGENVFAKLSLICRMS